MSIGSIVGIVIGALALIIIVTLLILLPTKHYFTALISGCYISIFKMISMKQRKLDVQEIVLSYILARKSHVGMSLNDIQNILSSGGHPRKIIEGLNAAKSAKLDIDIDFAKAVDTAGRDILEVVRECINPKLIELPFITSSTQDNREINAKISLTLKVNIKNFLRGVDDNTISARAVEAVVTKIANTETASEIVSRPQILDKAIFDAEIDEDSKYELVSADVIHVDYGTDRSVALEKEQIEKNRLMTANQLEQRRLVAVAVEQEMKAKAAEMQAKAIENEAEVPKAIIKAIEEGKIKDVVDYFKMQNLQADTEMRRQIISGKKD